MIQKRVRSLIAFIVCIVLVAASIYLASLIENDFGRVSVQQIRIPIATNNGLSTYIAAKLYIPDGVDSSNPAPAVLLLHGYQNDKDTSAAFAVELARRNIVALSIDEVTLQNNIETVLCKGNDKSLADIDARLQELQKELLKLANSKADYEKVGNEIYRLRDEKQRLQLENAGWDDLKKRIADMNTFLQEQPTTLTEYDETLVRRLVEKVIIYENKFIVEFKSGVTVDVDE